MLDELLRRAAAGATSTAPPARQQADHQAALDELMPPERAAAGRQIARRDQLASAPPLALPRHPPRLLRRRLARRPAGKRPRANPSARVGPSSPYHQRRRRSRHPGRNRAPHHPSSCRRRLAVPALPGPQGEESDPAVAKEAFGRETYKQRNAVERCINKLKQWRGLATRYDKTAAIYLAGLHIAAIFIWPAR
ncbi:transposase [Streptomyces sp. NEAU-LD23]|uniref:Uncharacterized protein n=1 Tax=Streptomyces botrytidirepellens TaxID=2486417 RepID=A0A3M8X7L7_9ACTN|nr:hypothetical protein EEJ42_01380 [Streptomyces botrytidirepellens]